jgi:hypothetical protein
MLRRVAVFLRSMLRLLLTANVVPSSPILVILLVETIHSSETSVLRRASRRNITEGGILHRLRLFENKAQRRIFGPKRNEMTGMWTKLHKSELHHLYFSRSIIRIMKPRRMRSTWHVARTRTKTNAFRILSETWRSETTRKTKTKMVTWY